MRTGSDGFTLIEIIIVVAILGVMIAMGVPAYSSISQSHQVKGAAENIASQVKLMRSKAMATGRPMVMHFAQDSATAGDYHVHDQGALESWELPRGIQFASGSSPGFTITRDGRVSTSSFVILQNARGHRDTVSIQVSGMVILP